MNIKDVEILFAKYRITKFNLIIPGYPEPYEVGQERIGNWTIEKNYEEDIYPYLEFRVIIPDEVYADVMDNSENVYVDLRIEYALFENMTEMNPMETVYAFGEILEDRFYAFIDNNSPKMTESVAGKEEEDRRDGDDLTQYKYDNVKSLVMGLYRADHIFNPNKIVNNVLSKCTVDDAVVYQLTQLGLAKQVLMSPGDNGETFDQLALAPLPGIFGLMYTINTYKLHELGTTVFLDYDTIYILNKKLGCTAWIPNEYKTVYLTSFPKTGDQMVMKTGFYSNSKEKYALINLIGNQISVDNESMMTDQTIGSNTVAIETNTGEVSQLTTSLKVSEMTPSKKGEINKVVVMDTGRDTVQQTATKIQQMQKTFNITVENVNIRALAPNKDYIFTTDDERFIELCGHYRITKMSAIFTKESTMFGVQCTATFVGGE